MEFRKRRLNRILILQLLADYIDTLIKEVQTNVLTKLKGVKAVSKPTNKYERRIANRRRLERLYDNGSNSYYPSGVVFIVNDDSYYERPKNRKYCIRETYSKKHNSQQNVTKYFKRLSNKKLRKSEGIYKDGQYKKVFDYWYTLW